MSCDEEIKRWFLKSMTVGDSVRLFLAIISQHNILHRALNVYEVAFKYCAKCISVP